MPPKTKTLDQIGDMQDKAVRFLRDVVGDPDKADEFESMSPEEYAEHKRISIKNRFSPAKQNRKGTNMATRKELQDRITELEEENQDLTDKLDSIMDIVSEDDEQDDDD